jgi:hypothetical protein
VLQKGLVAVMMLAACGDDAGNPATLYLSPDMMETKVKLIDHEPPPF